uniref:hypothetical protein n=1 Tax=Sphingomonas sp. TaxID=28214 RepID=UPI0025F1F129|nr:hypothetical protein [Sphingomonas sp.]
MRFSAAIGLILSASVTANVFYSLYPCNFYSCSLADNVFILSKDKAKRDFAARAVVMAREQFARLFTPATEKGSLLLDKDIKQPPVIRIQSYWVLRFDPFRPKNLSDVLSENPRTQSVKFVGPEYASIRMADDGMTGPIIGNRLDVTKHELCHVFFSSSMDGNRFSDAMDEIAGISCESGKSLDIRLDRFKALAASGVQMPWDKFLVMSHPIKRRDKLIAFLSDKAKESGTSVKFNVDNKSALGKEIDLFYAQSAVFVLTSQKKCPNQQVLSKLAENLSRGKSFSAWLANNGLACSPRTIGEFNVAVNQVLQQ